MPNDILATIDAALQDYDTSDDAMRWTPEPPRVICHGGDVLWPERRWYAKSGNTWHDLEGATIVFGRFCEECATQMFPAFAHAFGELVAAFNRSAGPLMGMLAILRDAHEYRRAELSRMHREYHRRRRARQRRKR